MYFAGKFKGVVALQLVAVVEIVVLGVTVMSVVVVRFHGKRGTRRPRKISRPLPTVSFLIETAAVQQLLKRETAFQCRTIAVFLLYSQWFSTAMVIYNRPIYYLL